MTGAYLYGWDEVNDTWVQIQVDSDGYLLLETS